MHVLPKNVIARKRLGSGGSKSPVYASRGANAMNKTIGATAMLHAQLQPANSSRLQLSHRNSLDQFNPMSASNGIQSRQQLPVKQKGQISSGSNAVLKDIYKQTKEYT